jgi:hypothetical protein
VLGLALEPEAPAEEGAVEDAAGADATTAAAGATEPRLPPDENESMVARAGETPASDPRPGLARR